MELFLEEWLSTVRFIALTYTFEELSDARTIGRIFRPLRTESGGFVDLGPFDPDLIRVSHAGPGLPLTYGMVKKPGGDFKVRSKEGARANFTVFLKKHPKESA